MKGAKAKSLSPNYGRKGKRGERGFKSPPQKNYQENLTGGEDIKILVRRFSNPSDIYTNEESSKGLKTGVSEATDTLYAYSLDMVKTNISKKRVYLNLEGSSPLGYIISLEPLTNRLETLRFLKERASFLKKMEKV